MDRNSVIGLVLIAAIMVGFMWWNQPSAETQRKLAQTRDSLAQIEKLRADSLAKISLGDSTESAQALSSESQDSLAADTTYVLENELLKVSIVNIGAQIKSVELKNFNSHDGTPVILLNNDSSFIRFNQDKSNHKFSFTGLLSEDQYGQSLTLSHEKIQFVYRLEKDSHLLKMDVRPLNGEKQMQLEWFGKMERKEKNAETERQNTTVYFRDKDASVDRVSPTSDGEEKPEKPLEWIGFKQQFFSAVLIGKNITFDKAHLQSRSASPSDTQSLKQLVAKAELAPANSTRENVYEFQWYFGPNHYKTLKKYDIGLEKIIPLGWGIFGWVNRFVVIPVFHFLDGFDLNYGIVILILTIIIKLLLLPLQFRSYKSQAKMRVLKPEVDEISKQYGPAEALQKQQAVMTLYRQAGVNPLGGCLPLLFQMPILLAMFSFFPAAIELRQQSFLWADDLSTYDSVLTLPFSVPFYGDHVSLFALLMTVSTILYTRMNSQLSTASNEQMASLKWLMYLMPVVFLFVLNSYPAGLNYYYFLANIITFGQQFAFGKLVNDEKLRVIIEENKKKPKSAKVSTFQKKLEEMAKQQANRAQSKPKKK